MDRVNARAEEADNDVLQAVRPSEAALLVKAFQRAVEARDVVCELLATLGVAIEDRDVVETMDAHGSPCIRIALRSTADQERLAEALPGLLRGRIDRPRGAA